MQLFNCWFLFVRPENSLLSRVDGCVEWPLGHWDFNNDLREVSTQDLLIVWWIGLQHKGQSWQWEAVNGEVFIKDLTPPLRRAGSPTGTTNMEASVLRRRAIFLLLSPALQFTEISALHSELLDTNSKGRSRPILEATPVPVECFGSDNVSASPLYLADGV